MSNGFYSTLSFDRLSLLDCILSALSETGKIITEENSLNLPMAVIESNYRLFATYRVFAVFIWNHLYDSWDKLLYEFVSPNFTKDGFYDTVDINKTFDDASETLFKQMYKIFEVKGKVEIYGYMVDLVNKTNRILENGNDTFNIIR